MSRKITPQDQLPCDIETHLSRVGDYYIWTDLNEEVAKPPILPIGGNMYYRFLNFLYLPQPPESLSTEQVIEVCDLRLEHLNKLVNYEYNSRIVTAIANYLLSNFPDMNSYTTKMKVLDFGCGSGLSLQLLNTHFPQLDMVGVDISKKAVQRSKEQGLNAIQTYADAPLPFEAASFDLIFAIFVMHFKIDIATLAELRRILRPEGKYVFNLYQRKIDGVEEELLAAGFSTVEIISALPEAGENHLIVSCSGLSSQIFLEE